MAHPVLLLLLLALPLLAHSLPFSLNQNFIAAPSPPFLLLPDALLSTTSTTPVQRQSLPSPQSSTPCSPDIPIHACCNTLYIPHTLQHIQCLASTTPPQPDHFPFNDLDPTTISTCLYATPSLLTSCCLSQHPSDPALATRCITVRRNILTSGLRVCLHPDPVHRARCCAALFLARPFLHRRCLAALPVFVNRHAPCVYAAPSSQSHCCAHIFPSATPNRAYTLCASLVARKTVRTTRCLRNDPAEKALCCSQDKLFGDAPYQRCLRRRVPPCRVDDFTSRVECCHRHFPDRPNRRAACMVREFPRCQLNSWRDRLACCASFFRVGSTDMRACVYQYLRADDVQDEDDRLAKCAHRYPPGSRHFAHCLLYPVKSCELVAEGDDEQLDECCEDYFDDDGFGFDVCVGKASFERLLAEYYARKDRWRPLSDASQTPQARVSYCLNTFARDEADRWYRYACLSEVTFAASDSALYHFSLFSDKAVVGHAQFACAIYDEAERESCCSVTYSGASQAYETCTSWRPTLGYADEAEISAEEARQLEMELTDARDKREIKALQPPPEGEQAQERERVRLFLEEMKRVEERLAQRTGAQLSDQRDAAQAPLFDAYYKFRALFREAVTRDEIATFYHIASKSWMACTLVRAESAPEDQGVLYCGKLAVIDESKVPNRKPVRGWESGALERIMAGAKHSSGTARFAKVNNGRRIAQAPDGEIAVDRQTEPEPMTEPESGNGAVTVNLFGNSEICPLSNLAYTCNALCCDSYYSECWLCGWQNLECVG